MMRGRGLSGPLFSKHANQTRALSKSAGAYNSPTGPGSTPVWAAIPDTTTGLGGSWSLMLEDYVTSNTPVTFTITGGALPASITMTTDGKFNGSITAGPSAGTVTYTATNLAGGTVSGTHNWTVT
jgi:hypothetical protein